MVTANSPSARHECGFIEVNGLFYLIGGRGIKHIDIYDNTTTAWQKGSEPPIEIHHFQAVNYGKDIYIMGAMTGKYPHETPLDRILIYKIEENSWVWGQSIPESRRRGSAGVVVKGDYAYVISGITDGHWSGHVPWLDKYNFKTGEWTVLEDAPRPRDHFHAAIKQGKIYCASGRNSSAKTNETFSLTIPEVDVYDINKNQWKTLPESSHIPTQRAGASSLIKNGYLMIIGGESSKQEMAHNEIEELDLSTGKWSTVGNLINGRHGTQAVIYDNKIYIVAGSGKRGGKPELSTLEVFSR
ncbi:kelch repeat-containing protein [Litoribaculum gwangyangense]|uniref:Kelch repeat-containing protein n=1 Tax=Litoribaculum gwangyangense TaxID=1130722 RepID=A0ABP9CNG9_9FLAO